MQVSLLRYPSKTMTSCESSMPGSASGSNTPATVSVSVLRNTVIWSRANMKGLLKNARRSTSSGFSLSRSFGSYLTFCTS